MRKVFLRQDGIRCEATFSACGRYRYRLKRRWGAGDKVLFVMLNPSTADAQRDDPTIRRCIGFARKWGFGSVEVVNLFAYRATKPEALKRVDAPTGPANSRAVRNALRRARLVVIAWGNSGAFQRGGIRMLDRLRHTVRSSKLVALGWTRLGHPRHVLYISGDCKPMKLANRQTGICPD